MGVMGWLDEKLGGVDEAVGSAVDTATDAVGDAANATWGAVSEAAGTVRDEVGSVLGFDTRAENAQQEQAAKAKEQGQQLREELAQRNQRLDAPAGYDPASITQQENWQSYDHRRIYDTNQNTLSQSDAAAVAEGWRNIGKELSSIGDELVEEATRAIDSGWSGEAAEAAKQSAQPLAKWSRGSGECFQLTGNKIEESGSAAGQVKAMVPEPQDHDVSQTVVSGIATGGLGAGADALRQMHERQQAERKAQETMDRVLGATYRNVDTTVPAYRQLDGKKAPPGDSKPDDPGTAGIPPGTGPGGGTGGGAGTAGYPGGGYSGGGPGTGQGSGSGWDGQSQRPGGSGTGTLPGGGSAVPPSGSESAWATPPSAGGAGAGAGGPGAGGAAGGAGGAGAGGGAVAGGYAGGGPGGAGAGSGLGQGGRSGTGAVRSGGGPAAGGGGSAASSAGRGGAGRAPMGMGAGQGGQGGEEEEHERPSWLEEWDDVWFNDMPKTAPPVIE
ncbi:PPE domain-containing protein [Actinopolyspora saharensis]|uniref:PPE domain-containing protein n=1 Tax=Actinopolyspora saharensis TaxID=995062 RepID=UPI003F668F6B